MLTPARVKIGRAPTTHRCSGKKYGLKPPEMKHNDLIGSPAVPFMLKDAYGRPHSFDQYRGRWLLMVFLRHLG
jgi:cytochrome oxidase Cu insertion factor (SCO1/SenC/PrrC family)